MCAAEAAQVVIDVGNGKPPAAAVLGRARDGEKDKARVGCLKILPSEVCSGETICRCLEKVVP
jgi:hypothetical protein